jgi:hypothetical protein
MGKLAFVLPLFSFGVDDSKALLFWGEILDK